MFPLVWNAAFLNAAYLVWNAAFLSAAYIVWNAAVLNAAYQVRIAATKLKVLIEDNLVHLQKISWLSVWNAC